MFLHVVRGEGKREIIRKAREAYYNLPSQGLIEFQSAVIPDWPVTLKEELKTEIPPDHPALKILDTVHFWWSLDQKGSAKLTHQRDAMPLNEKSMQDLNQAISGIEEVLSGFSSTMAPFLFTSPFPEIDASYELEEMGNLYQVSYKEGQYAIAITMKKDFAITEMKVSGPAFSGSMKPVMKSTSKGFLVGAYQGEYQSSSPGGNKGFLSAEITYGEADGLMLPAEAHFDVATVKDGPSHKIYLRFRDFQIKKR